MAKKEKTLETSATENKNNVLEKVGKTAIKEHELPQVFVTSDGTVFKTENDAKNYAVNLKDKSILNIKK